MGSVRPAAGAYEAAEAAARIASAAELEMTVDIVAWAKFEFEPSLSPPFRVTLNPR